MAYDLSQLIRHASRVHIDAMTVRPSCCVFLDSQIYLSYSVLSISNTHCLAYFAVISTAHIRGVLAGQAPLS